MKGFFEGVQQAYIDYIAGPFVKEGESIVSKKFDSRIAIMLKIFHG